MRDLSHRMTWLWKFGFPSLWIAGFGLGTIAFFLNTEVQSDPLVAGVRWLFLFGLVLMVALVYWGVGRLKRVQLDKDEFVISNFRKEIRINIRDVEKVTRSNLRSPELACLHLKIATEFGSSVQFMLPARDSFNPFSRHPLVNELNELIGQANGT